MLPARIRIWLGKVSMCLLLASCGGDTELVAPSTGSIALSTSTTGAPLDPDGYSVMVDGTEVRAVGINTVTLLTDLAEGAHDVELTGVASDCEVQGSNPRSVTVTAGDTASTAFAVSCSLPITSAIAVVITTTGPVIDLDGYIATVDGTDTQSVGVNDSTVFADLAEGDHGVDLTGVTSDCVVQGPNPRTVNVAPGDTAATAFAVDCSLAQLNQIVFTSGRSGNTDIYVMNADGSQVTLTTDPASDIEPTWSPDGSKVAFTTGRDGNLEIYVMNADGSNPVNLTNHPADELNPAWSPDGAKIAFRSDRDGDFEIYVIDADGSNETRLTNNPAQDLSPAWSPDGSKIAFTTTRDVDAEIYVMDPDGSNPINLTNNPATDLSAAWSPDGSKIAFSTFRFGNYDIYSMDADGFNPVRLTSDPDWDDAPSWSPDGSRIVFSTYRGANFDDRDIYVIDADGSNRVGLTQDSSSWGPDWHP